jgi:NAD(P)-dependent dehydrogenase (short-subunit alcohol dehydrogenase family)
MRTWFITGADRGLGHAFAAAALDRGDRVVAAAPRISPVDFDGGHDERLLTLPLDVTDREAVFDALETATEYFGGLDVVVNHSGEPLAGMVSALTADGLHAVG